MRLLNTSSLRLEVIATPDKDQRYAILSHTWGQDEVLFEDVQNGSFSNWSQKKGASKIIASCKKAASQGLRYIWVDTCCIDKSSSAELSEAINSMFRWYRQADVCYAYLDDFVRDSDVVQASSNPEELLSQCRWFTRGWTLQELIAPRTVTFFDSCWNAIGDRMELSHTLASITGVEEFLFHYTPKQLSVEGFLEDRLRSISIAKRMTWAASRSTTRPEDAAYSLMGIFNVNMPLLYGEGRTKSLIRLQEEIIRNSGDQSILAHNSYFTISHRLPQFHQNIMQIDRPSGAEIDFAEGGLALEVLLCRVTLTAPAPGEYFLAILNCTYDDFLTRPALLVVRDEHRPNRYRKASRPPVLYRVSPWGCFSNSMSPQRKLIVSTETLHLTQKAHITLELENRATAWDEQMRITVPVILNIAPEVLQQYTICFVEPKKVGKLMLTIWNRISGIDDTTYSMGLLVLRNGEGDEVGLSWGYTVTSSSEQDDRARTLLPWCRMRPLADLDKIGYSRSQGTPLEWLTNIYDDSKGTVAHDDWIAYPLAARITSETFLDKTMFKLKIQLEQMPKPTGKSGGSPISPKLPLANRQAGWPVPQKRYAHLVARNLGRQMRLFCLPCRLLK